MIVEKTELKSCSVCDGTSLEAILDLPNLPQIGIYLNLDDSQESAPCVDNALMVCQGCGHVQMQYAVDPAFLYNSDFQHKTSQSSSAMQANDFLYSVVKKYAESLEGSVVAEVGCNDTFFLTKFAEEFGCKVVGVDPTLKGHECDFLSDLAPDIAHKFSILGDFIENVNFRESIGSSPQVVVSNFVFEHLMRPREVVSSMLEAVGDDGICLIGVPTLEFMCFNARFDQMSHQHYQQFSVRALHQLIETVGGEIIGCESNYTNWGQTVVIFRRGKASERYKSLYRVTHDDLAQSLSIFKDDIRKMKLKVEFLSRDRRVFGFGAAQNFPIFSYFCDHDLPFGKVLDDHPLRQNKKFPFVQNIVTEKPSENYEGAVGVLTGPDYARVLFGRMGQLKFDHIVSPFSSY